MKRLIIILGLILMFSGNQLSAENFKIAIGSKDVTLLSRPKAGKIAVGTYVTSRDVLKIGKEGEIRLHKQGTDTIFIWNKSGAYKVGEIVGNVRKSINNDVSTLTKFLKILKYGKQITPGNIKKGGAVNRAVNRGGINIEGALTKEENKEENEEKKE